MSLVMTEAERESFLTGTHIGVLVWMDRDSHKDRAIRREGRFSPRSRAATSPPTKRSPM